MIPQKEVLNKATSIGEHKSNVHRLSDDVVIDFGEYWRYCPAAIDTEEKQTLIPDNIYIIVDVQLNVINDEIHTVSIYKPSKDGGYAGKCSMNIEEFLNDFKPVTIEEAQAIRKAELGLLEADAKRIGDEISLALSDPQALLALIGSSDDEAIVKGRTEMHTGFSLPSPEMMKSSGTDLIGNAQSLVEVDRQKKTLENQAKLGELAGLLTARKSKELSTVLDNSTNLLMENARAITGKADDMNRKVKGLLKKVSTMKLYLGEKVKAEVIIDGEPAKEITPYLLFSQMVYMSDEVATERIFSDDSFDFTNKQDFFNLLKSHPAILARVLPTERCIVTIRPSLNSRSYSKEELSINEWASRDQANKRAFLLVKDGDRICAIYSPITYKPRLYPTDKEMDSFFEYTLSDSTNRVDAQRKFADSAEDYRALCAVMQGVKDRQLQGEIDVFGELPSESTGNSFMSSHLIKQNCTFVNDEDELLGNPDMPTDIYAWLRQFTNTGHNKGDLIVYPRNLLDQSTIPSAYRYVERLQEDITDWEIPYNTDNLQSGRIALHKGEPYILVELAKQWGDEVKNFRAFIKNSDRDFFNVMALPLTMVDKILLSREHRALLVRSGYMEMLIEARTLLKGLFASGKLVVDGLMSYYPNYSSDQIHLLFMTWYRIAKESDIANLTTGKAKNIVTKIVNEHHKSLAFNDTVIEKAKDQLIESGEVPLFSSVVEGKLFILTDGSKSASSYHIDTGKLEHSFFNGYQVSSKGVISSIGLVGSDIQQYPIKSLFVDDLAPYKLDAPRLAGAQWTKLDKNARKMFTNYVKWIKAFEIAINSGDEEKAKLIAEFVKNAVHYKEYTKSKKGNVTIGEPLLPVTLETYRGQSAIYGFTFNFNRAITHLFYAMTSAGRMGIDDFDDDIEDAFSWTDMLEDLKRISPIDSIIACHHLDVIGSSVDNLVYTEIAVLSKAKGINKKDAFKQMQLILSAQVGSDILERMI